MKHLLKITAYFLLLFVSVAIGVVLCLVIKANDEPSVVTLKAIDGMVTVKRDRYQVPHIIALTSDEDAFFALGYLHAHDRLWQMEMQRRIAAGRLSEVFGDKTIKQDEYLRTWGFYHAAESAWQSLDPKTKQIVHAYTLGVNTYLAEGKLPIQFYLLHFKPAPWTEIDAVAWQKMMAWNLDTSWQRKIQNYLVAKKTNRKMVDIFFPPYPEKAPTILTHRDLALEKLVAKNSDVADDDNESEHTAITDALTKQLTLNNIIRNELGFADKEGKGSNAWVVSGRLTTTGKPILANDVHLPLGAPSLFYLAELRGPTLHVIGATIAGLPMVAIGHNDYIAWGVTHSYTDTQDLYIEDEHVPLIIHSEVIRIKGHEPEILQVKASIHGPIISDISDAGRIGHYVAIKWPALMTGDTTVESFAKINNARNWKEFVSALRYYVTPPQNFLYADTSGNIGYYLGGKIPLRLGWVGTYPTTTNQKNEWQGYIPFAKLPHVFNPPEGFIAAANNKIVPDDYPYSLTFRWNITPYRIERIIDGIKHEPVDMQHAERLQLNTDSYLWRDLRSKLLQVQPKNDSSKQALATLQKWDGHVEIGSIGATIFAYWYQALLQPSNEINEKPTVFDPQFIVQSLQNDRCYSSYTKQTDCGQRLAETLASAVAKLKMAHGNNMKNWRWGDDVHRAAFEEIVIGKSPWVGWLWNRTIASPGGDFTVNAGTYDPRNMNQINGANYRQVIDLNDFEGSAYLIPLGQIDNPFGFYYNNQLPLWVKGGYLTIH